MKIHISFLLTWVYPAQSPIVVSFPSIWFATQVTITKSWTVSERFTVWILRASNGNRISFTSDVMPIYRLAITRVTIVVRLFWNILPYCNALHLHTSGNWSIILKCSKLYLPVSLKMNASEIEIASRKHIDRINIHMHFWSFIFFALGVSSFKFSFTVFFLEASSDSPLIS